MRPVRLAPGYQLAALAKPQAGFSPRNPQHHPSTCRALSGMWGRKKGKGWWGPPGPGGVERRWEEVGALKVTKGSKAAVMETATLGKYRKWDLLIPRGTNSPGRTDLPGKGPHRQPGPSTPHPLPLHAGLWDPSGRHALARPDGGLVHVGTKLTQAASTQDSGASVCHTQQPQASLSLSPGKAPCGSLRPPGTRPPVVSLTT